MITQKQIKDDYAVSKGYKDFDDLLISVINYEILSEQISEVMKIYARECLKRASENLEWHEMQIINDEENIIK